MKILHTSDWHLGQILMGRSREEEHRAFLDWLHDVVEKIRPDALVVAGDVFDTGTPPNYALRLYYDFLSRMHALGVHTVIVAGNHDSASSLAAPRSLLEALGITVISHMDEDPLVPIHRDGRSVGIICAVPFLRESEIRKSVSGLTSAERERAVAVGIRHHYAEIHAKAVESTQGRDMPIVATGHLTTLGASGGSSEREIYVGSLMDISADFLAELFDYVALGHLHRRQRVGETDVWYSGSPLPMDFSEASQTKFLNLVTFEGHEPKVEGIEIPRFRPFLRFSGDRNTLLRKLEEVEDPRSWIEMRLADDNPHAASQALFEAANEKGLELLAVKTERKEVSLGSEETEVAGLEEITPLEVFEMRLAMETIGDDTFAEQLKDAFRNIVSEVEKS